MVDSALPPEERDMLAAELVLGVLTGDERAQALRLQLSDPSFRQAVETWEMRLLPLSEAFAEAPPPDLWPAIEARLREATGANAEIAAIRRRLRGWRIGAVASSAVAAALALLLFFYPAPSPVPSTPAIVAQLGTGTAQFVANYDPARAQLRIRTIALPTSPLSPELWVIPAGGAPQSLGLVAPQGGSLVTVPEKLRAQLRDGATLAVTLERREGVPHMAPSSTPIAAGTLRTL